MESDPDYRESVLAAVRSRGYRAAGTDDTRSPWVSGNWGRSADGHILFELPRIRERSRELCRDDPIASGVIGTMVDQCIGPGILAQARTGSKKKDNRIEAVWDRIKDTLHPQEEITYSEAQRLKFRKTLEDGDVFVAKFFPKGLDGLRFQIIEADRCRHPGGLSGSTYLPEGHEIRDGVQRTPEGIREKYWFLKHHPGEILGGIFGGVGAAVATYSSFAGGSIADFLSMDPEDVRHLRRIQRPGQTRGVPWFHSVMQDLRDLDLLIIASLKRTQVAACLSAFITSDLPLDQFVDITAEKYGYKMNQQLEPGAMWKLYPGETITTLNPNFPTTPLLDFIIALARRIGSGLGLSWQTILRDYSASNYSSARTDLLGDRLTYRSWQRWFIDYCLGWERFQVLMHARDIDGLPELRDCSDEDLASVRWQPPGWPWVDPQREARAAELKLLSGLTTIRDEAAGEGKDWEDLIYQKSLEEKFQRDSRIELGLPPMPDVALSPSGRPLEDVDIDRSDVRRFPGRSAA
jgi:lambda family phage portal protein